MLTNSLVEGGETRGDGFESTFAVGCMTAGVGEVDAGVDGGGAVIVGGFGWSSAKITTKATQPKAATTATPNAISFQRFNEGGAGDGAAAAGGGIFWAGGGGRLTGAIAGAVAGAGD